MRALREAVEQVRTGQGQVRDEAAKLVNALQANSKTRGRWGEQSLYNVLEQAGLTEARRLSQGSLRRHRGRPAAARCDRAACRAGAN